MKCWICENEINYVVDFEMESLGWYKFECTHCGETILCPQRAPYLKDFKPDYIREALELGGRYMGTDKQEPMLVVRRGVNKYLKEYWCKDKEDVEIEKKLYSEMRKAVEK